MEQIDTKDIGPKQIIIVVRHSPFNTSRNAEGLRMSVGLTLKNDAVSVVFLADGVYHASTKLKPELIGAHASEQEFEMFNMLGCGLFADKIALERAGIVESELRDGVKGVAASEIADMLAKADVVIPF
ncbi:MAG: DsrE family protein [Methanosarcinales archaeon]|nr:DsrE family protein [Methanosarcinales archaeon]